MADPIVTATCPVPDCDGSPVTFDHFPTVVGYCLTHGNVVADFLSLIDLPATAQVGFDGQRARWENIYRRSRAG